MFIPKGESVGEASWNETLFWNVYYVKGAFLNADAAFEVLQGIRTLESADAGQVHQHDHSWRASSTRIPRSTSIATFWRPTRTRSCATRKCSSGLPAPLFTIDFEQAGISRAAFQRFFDNLSPTFGHMISLGQSNTIVSCPALTTHSELPPEELARTGILATTIRFAVGDEDPRDLLAHLVETAKITIDPVVPGFSGQFPDQAAAYVLIRDCYLDVHRRYIEAKCGAKA